LKIFIIFFQLPLQMSRANALDSIQLTGVDIQYLLINI
jgi:hypothetical protein